MSGQDVKPKSLGAEEYEVEGYHSPGFVIDPEAERRVIRKLDLRLIPWLSLLYLISFLDRTNIGNAKIQGQINFFSH